MHALKSHANAKSCTTQTSVSAHNPTANTPTTTAALTIVIPSLGQVTPVTVGGMLGAAASANSPTGGVLGALAGAKSHGVRGGVLGAVAAKRHGKLPFTGFPIWVALLIGFSLTAAGLSLRHYARATI